IVVTDVIIAWFLLAGTGLFETLTGWFILARRACLAVLIAVGVVASRGRRAATKPTPGDAAPARNPRPLLPAPAGALARGFAAAVAAYVVALRTARRRGVAWPVGRTIAWCGGWALAVVATSSGLGKYSVAHFGIHMVVHMSLSMMAPVLLVLGGFVTLLLRANRAGGPQHRVHDWITCALAWKPIKDVYNLSVYFV